MLGTSVWLHIFFGAVIGTLTTIFIYEIIKTIRSNKSIETKAGKLYLYVFSVSIVIFLYETAISGGFFVEWQSLGQPKVMKEGSKIIEIVEIGYVKSQAGKIYHWTNPYSRFNGQWEQVDTVVEDPELRIIPDCKGFPLAFLPKTRKNFIDFKKACISSGLYTVKTAYAVDGYGEVYIWSYGNGEYSGFMRLIYPVYGCLLSFGFGIFFINIITKITHSKQKSPKEV